MSYILEALKKSERERKLGEVPQLATRHDIAAPTAEKRGWTMAIATAFGGIGLGALGVAGYLFTSSPPAPMSPATEVSTPRPEPIAPPAPSPSDAPAGVGATSPEPGTPPLAGASRAQPPVAADAPTPTQRPTTVETPRPSPSLATGSDPSSPDDARRPAPPPSTPGPSAITVPPRPRIPPAPARPHRSSSPPPRPPDRPTPGIPPSGQSLPTLDQLPASRRPPPESLRMNIHAYADNPERRFVLINMRRYREGDRLEDGTTLQFITPDGAILEHQGKRFHLPRQ